MTTFDELLATRSPESRARITARADEIRQEKNLASIREELNLSKMQVAAAMGIKQSAVVKMEKADNDPKLSTLKRHIKAMGG